MQAGFDKKRSCCQFCTSVRVCAGPGLRPLAATEPRNETHSGQALSHLVRHVAKESSSTIELSTAWRLVAEPGVRVCQCKNGTVAHATACAVPVQSIASRTRVTFVGNVVCSHTHPLHGIQALAPTAGSKGCTLDRAAEGTACRSGVGFRVRWFVSAIRLTQSVPPRAYKQSDTNCPRA